jgi:hypothetical protein
VGRVRIVPLAGRRFEDVLQRDQLHGLSHRGHAALQQRTRDCHGEPLLHSVPLPSQLTTSTKIYQLKAPLIAAVSASVKTCLLVSLIVKKVH